MSVKEGHACEKGMGFLKSRSVSACSKGRRNTEEMGLFPGPLDWILTCGEEETVRNTLNKTEIGSLVCGESHTRCHHREMWL